MKQRDEDALKATLALPDGYEYGYDFVDYNQGDRGSRVVRIIGPDRFLMLFDYGEGGPLTKSPWARLKYGCRFLHENNDLVAFDPKAVLAAAATSQNPHPSWDRVMTDHLREQGARSFKGRGWAAALTMKIANLIRRWEKHYSNVKAST